jgi:hypothetical protein
MENLTTLADWLAYCEQMHPKGINGIELGLDRIRTVAQRMQLRFDCPVFTVAGTNGKGSTDRHFNHMRPSIAPQNSLRTTGISSQSHSGALVGSAAAKKSVVQENDFHRAGCARHRDTPQSACLTTLACHQLIR